jgi:hypothetical protein
MIWLIEAVLTIAAGAIVTLIILLALDKLNK